MKKFVEDKKRQIKFKLAGPGHRLTSDGAGSSSDNPSSASLNAALQRCEKQQSDFNKGSSSHQSKKNPFETTPPATSFEDKEEMDVNQVNSRILFTSPELGDGVHPMNTWMEKAKDYIETKKLTDKIEASIIAIKTMNPENEVQFAVKILQKYLSNLINHPDDEKYKVIRLGNPNIQKLMGIEGAVDFLLAVGFEYKSVSFEEENSHKEETYLVHVAHEDLDLPKILEFLESVKGITFSLYRNARIIMPGPGGIEEEPDVFYEWTIHDMKKETKFRKNESEKNQQLRTRKMRGEKTKPKSDFTCIRVRLPDGSILQATFATNETLSDLRAFIIERMQFTFKFFFVLLPLNNYEESEESKTFLELDLYPSVTLMIKSCTNQES